MHIEYFYLSVCVCSIVLCFVESVLIILYIRLVGITIVDKVLGSKIVFFNFLIKVLSHILFTFFVLKFLPPKPFDSYFGFINRYYLITKFLLDNLLI